ncbi:hypothetical protein BHQ29_19325 [Pseudomonas sp. LPH1]|nr:hypothetical protein [Pseudomonas sp. LPH1]AQZ35214.1 hypothetical protein BHQ29_19325 [Pseudomonas sp. LPH1]
MTPATQLIYMAFGAATYRREAVFRIVSALTQANRCTHTEPLDVRVLTDAPSFFGKRPAQTRAIDPDWADPHRYPFRIKHMILEVALRNCIKAALIDTDTFFRESPAALPKRVASGKLLSNSIGRPVSEVPLLPCAMLARLKQAEPSLSPLRQSNSGVIGLMHSDRAVLERPVAWKGELRPLSTKLHTLEGLHLALAAHDRMELNACANVVHHYWSRKTQFRTKVEAWFAKHNAAPLSKEAMQDRLMISDRLPHPTQSCRSWQNRVIRLISGEHRQFIRERLHGCHTYPHEFDRRLTGGWRGKALSNAQERLGRPLSLNALQAWLNNPPLKYWPETVIQRCTLIYSLVSQPTERLAHSCPSRPN